MELETDPTHAVLLTPEGRGAIATILVAGPEARSAVAAHFTAAKGRALDRQPCDRTVFGHWGGRSGEEAVLCIGGPDRVEVHCHGGRAVVEWILCCLEESGCVRLGWQEWTRHDAPSPIGAEARIALAEATTERSAAILLDQYHGALDRELAELADLVAQAEVADGPSQDDLASEAAARLNALLGRAPLGLHLVRPWRVAIGGRPNVGKSTLLNALAGFERAIVHGRPGTTRDVVTFETAFGGWPVLLADTAGLRDADDELESAGIDQAERFLDSADLTVLALDRSRPLADEDRRLMDRWGDALRVANKIDLPDRGGPGFPRTALEVSARTLEGVDRLAGEIHRRLVRDCPEPGSAVPFTSAQFRSLKRARASLAQGDFCAARDFLLEPLRLCKCVRREADR